MLRIAMTAVALMMSTGAFSAITLSVPEEIKLLAVNKQEVKAKLFSSMENYKLDAGTHLLDVRYSEYFQHHDNSHDILKSGIVTLQTPDLQDGQNYYLALIDAPEDFDQAQQYKHQPMIGLYNAHKQLLAKQVGTNEKTKPLLGSGITKGSVTDLTQKQLQEPPAIYNSNITATAAAQIKPLDSASEQDLIQTWQKASKAERQKFMNWLAEQSK